MPGSPAPTGARVDRDLTRRQGEDQPPLAGIDPFEAEHIAKKLASSLSVLGEDDRVCAGDHGVIVLLGIGARRSVRGLRA